MNPLGLTLRETAQRPCLDCPAWYAREMRQLGCCNGFYGGELRVVSGAPFEEPVIEERARDARGRFVA